MHFSTFLIFIHAFIALTIPSTAQNVGAQKTNLSTLRLVQVVFRHGDRSPLITYPNDPYGDFSIYWPDGTGQLTDVGVDQHFELGKFFRNRFGGFLSEIYSRPEIHVLSSDTDRTLMSAEANLIGLYPKVDGRLKSTGKMDSQTMSSKLGVQLVPIHTKTRDRDEVLHMTASCPRRSQAKNEFFATSPEYEKLNEENKDFLNYVQENAGTTFADIFSIVKVQDPLFCQRAHNLTLPEWANSTVMKKMAEIRGIGFAMTSGTTELKRLHGGPLVKRLVQHMKSRANHVPDDNRKMFMHSAHDDTLAAVLSSLGVFDPQVPSYASALLVELHEEEKTGKHYVEMFYRNTTSQDPHKLHVHGCSSPCYLNEMETLLQPVIPQDYEKECQLKNILSAAPSEGPNTPTPIVVIYKPGLTTLLCFLAVLAVAGLIGTVVLSRREKRMKQLYMEIA